MPQKLICKHMTEILANALIVKLHYMDTNFSQNAVIISNIFYKYSITEGEINTLMEMHEHIHVVLMCG
jgi:hypothetical protein